MEESLFRAFIITLGTGIFIALIGEAAKWPPQRVALAFLCIFVGSFILLSMSAA